MKMYNVVLADDHVLFRQGLKSLLRETPFLEVVGEAGDGVELLNLLNHGNLNPRLVILDISMPNLRGIEAISEIKARFPAVKILILTMHQDAEYLYEALAAGADGYALKQDAAEELVMAIEKIHSGKFYVSKSLAKKMVDVWGHFRRKLDGPVLTNREREIIQMVAEGKSNKEIAVILFISIHTVERHRANIMKKLDLKGTAELVKYAIQKGYIT